MSEFSAQMHHTGDSPTGKVKFGATVNEVGTTDMDVHRTSEPPPLVVIWQCERIRRNRLRNGTGADESHRNLACHNSTIFDDLDLLQILTVNAFTDSSGLASVTAQILCLAAFNFLVSPARLQVSIQLHLSRTLDAFVFLQGTHDTKQFLIRRLEQ